MNICLFCETVSDRTRVDHDATPKFAKMLAAQFSPHNVCWCCLSPIFCVAMNGGNPHVCNGPQFYAKQNASIGCVHILTFYFGRRQVTV